MSKWRILAAIIAIVLTGCGGSSNTNTEDIVDDLDNEIDAPIGGDSDASDSEGVPEPSNEPESPDIDAPDIDVGEPSVGDITVDEDTPDISVGTDQPRVLLAIGTQAPGTTDGILSAVNEIVVSDNGIIAFSGQFTVGSERISAVWYGPIDEPSLLIQSSDGFIDASPSVRFESASNLQLTSNDTLGFFASLSGSETRDGYAITTESGVSLLFVPGVTSAVDFAGTTQIADRVTDASLSDAGVALRMRSDEKEFIAILAVDGSTTYIAETVGFIETAPSQQRFTGSNCPFEIPSTGGQDLFVYLDNGELILEVSEDTERGELDQCGGGLAIVRFSNGLFTEIIGQSDLLPGSNSSVTSLGTGTRIVGSNQAGDIIVRTGTTLVDNERVESLWRFSRSGDADLIAIEGESIQLSTRAGEFENFLPDQISFLSGQFAVTSRVANTSGLFAGTIRQGQPHENLALPGASALNVIIAEDGLSPSGFSESVFFSGISEPFILTPNNLFFVGTLTDAATSQVVDESLWRSDFEGGLDRLISVGDDIAVNGEVEQIVQGLFGAQTIGDNGFVFRGSGNEVLVGVETVTPGGTAFNARFVLLAIENGLP